MHIEEFYQNYFLPHPSICTDTRKISDGCLFFALKGDNFNGNTFAAKAIESGAAYAIVDEAGAQINSQCILVPNVLDYLQELATYHRKQLNIPVIAIVGSNGKTTTKELISAVLSTHFHLLSTPGNFNNHIGLPLTLLMLNKNHQLAVIEMGANHEEENALLCEIACPTHGMVTNNGKDHLEGFGSMEGVIRSNKELYTYLHKHQGIAFVNGNDPSLLEMAEGLTHQIVYAANHGNLKTRAKWIGSAYTLQPEISFLCEGNEMHSSLSGDYNFDNIMAAVAMGMEFKVPIDKIAEGISNYKPQNLRSQLIETAKNKIFLDAYNANPSSMEVSIRNFAAMPGEHKLLILGDMFELGAYEAEEHQALTQYCEMLGLTNVWLVGKAFFETKNNFQKFQNTQSLIGALQANPLLNRYVFIKGSRGMKLESIIEQL